MHQLSSLIIGLPLPLISSHTTCPSSVVYIFFNWKRLPHICIGNIFFSTERGFLIFALEIFFFQLKEASWYSHWNQGSLQTLGIDLKTCGDHKSFFYSTSTIAPHHELFHILYECENAIFILFNIESKWTVCLPFSLL